MSRESACVFGLLVNPVFVCERGARQCPSDEFERLAWDLSSEYPRVVVPFESLSVFVFENNESKPKRKQSVR